MSVISVKDLSVTYHPALEAVRGVSVELEKGKTLAVVGESGCGKSTLAMSILGLILPDEGRITAGEVSYGGKDIITGGSAEWRRIRGKEISMVFQDPFSSLNPVLKIGVQITEAILAHDAGIGKYEAKKAAIKSLEEVLFSEPERIFNSYPHQISGGQRQRVALAIAIVNRPKVLIADEPTTALDVTIQKEIMDLIDDLKHSLGLTIVLVTHNLPLAKQRSDSIAVMYAGQIVETGGTEEVLKKPLHPYTRGLIASVPRMFECVKTSSLSGHPPDMNDLPPGCAFAPRCPRAMDICRNEKPSLLPSGSIKVRCFLYSKKG
ncbi:MAG: ABC transporter ATP-binding protein [Endomicrobiales bacterium]|nr:ABC transporter ATP-binding protein [Endomicrobiales bacterium]